MPSLSTGSSDSRKPAVSMKCTGTPSRSTLNRIASRVVPANGRHDGEILAGQAIEQARLADIGLPASTTCMPSRRRLPCREASSTADELLAAGRSGAAAMSACLTKSISSSGKSSVASTSTRRSISSRRSAVMRCENSPWSERSAQRAACGGAGLDQVGDGLRLGEIELVVEIGALREFAGLGDARAQLQAALHRRRRTTGPPWPCSSRTSSPVYECGAGK